MAKDCIHLGNEIKRVRSNLCSTRGKTFPVFHCKLLDLDCTRTKHTSIPYSRICLTCDKKQVETDV